MVDDSLCPFCCRAEETDRYLFVECGFPCEVWQMLGVGMERKWCWVASWLDQIDLFQSFLEEFLQFENGALASVAV